MRAKNKGIFMRDRIFYKGGIRYAICSYCGRVRNFDESPVCPSPKCIKARLREEGKKRKQKEKEQRTKERRERKRERNRLRYLIKRKKLPPASKETEYHRYWREKHHEEVNKYEKERVRKKKLKGLDNQEPNDVK